MNYCRFCGSKLQPPQARFCPNCGKKLIFEEPDNTLGASHLDTSTVCILPESRKSSNLFVEDNDEREMTVVKRHDAPLEMPSFQAMPAENVQSPTQQKVIREEAQLPAQSEMVSTHVSPGAQQEILSEGTLLPATAPQDEHTQLSAANISHGLFARRYKLIKRIGDGHMSEVYQAEDTKHGNTIVAVKLLNTLHKDMIKQEMYLRETRALELLEHPNIIKHLDYGWSDEQRCHYIVLEYLPHTLVDEIAMHSDSSDQEWCWPLMRDITDALVHAHSKKIIHRDLKSTNILISESGMPKLTDFGISLLRFEMRTGVTLSSFWSEGFAAPEQRNMQETTVQSDIYSLGCVFYHMLSRREPPAGGLTQQDIQALNLRPLVQLMFERMLDPEARNRFESAAL
jgi:hypothetical protein